MKNLMAKMKSNFKICKKKYHTDKHNVYLGDTKDRKASTSSSSSADNQKKILDQKIKTFLAVITKINFFFWKKMKL
jgi:hypothetical protein